MIAARRNCAAPSVLFRSSAARDERQPPVIDVGERHFGEMSPNIAHPSLRATSDPKTSIVRQLRLGALP